MNFINLYENYSNKRIGLCALHTFVIGTSAMLTSKMLTSGRKAEAITSIQREAKIPREAKSAKVQKPLLGAGGQLSIIFVISLHLKFFSQ